LRPHTLADFRSFDLIYNGYKGRPVAFKRMPSIPFEQNGGDFQITLPVVPHSCLD
jgi:hypothetical protein